MSKLSLPETLMRQTMEWLLALPAEERERMELAEPLAYTRAEPAPERHAGEPSADGARAMVLNKNCNEATALLCGLGYSVALHNFAHSYNCGGGFEHAGGSQEEAIFRASSLFLSLWPHRREDDGPGVLARGQWIGDFDELLARKAPFYPLSECGGVYSPHVRMVRVVDEGYNAPLRKPEQVAECPTFAVITVAAQDVPRDGVFEEDLLEQKVRTVLQVALDRGHDALVLGAFGCGYFGNPPEVVAKTFARLLQGEFAHVFPIVVFAIPDQGGRNLIAFQNEFPTMAKADFKALRRSANASDASATNGANATGSGKKLCCGQQ